MRDDVNKRVIAIWQRWVEVWIVVYEQYNEVYSSVCTMIHTVVTTKDPVVCIQWCIPYDVHQDDDLMMHIYTMMMKPTPR